MNNLEIVTEILTSDCQYFVIAKKTYYREYLENKRGDDRIIMILISQDINTNLSREYIKLTDIEKLNSIYFDANIYLNTDFPPFQFGTNLYDVYDIIPVRNNHKKIMTESLLLKSNNFCDYKKLIQKYNE